MYKLQFIPVLTYLTLPCPTISIGPPAVHSSWIRIIGPPYGSHCHKRITLWWAFSSCISYFYSYTYVFSKVPILPNYNYSKSREVRTSFWISILKYVVFSILYLELYTYIYFIWFYSVYTEISFITIFKFLFWKIFNYNFKCNA